MGGALRQGSSSSHGASRWRRCPRTRRQRLRPHPLPHRWDHCPPAGRGLDRPASHPRRRLMADTGQECRADSPRHYIGLGAGPGAGGHLISRRHWGLFPVSGCGAVPRQLFLPVWRQLFLPVHLLGLAPLLGCIGAVAGDVKLQDDGVMDHSIDGRGGGHGVGEDVFPLREDQV